MEPCDRFIDRINLGASKCICAAALSLGLLYGGEAAAAVYYYQDESGRVHITDTPPHKGYKVIVPSVKEQLSINDGSVPSDASYPSYQPSAAAPKSASSISELPPGVSKPAKTQAVAKKKNAAAAKSGLGGTSFYEADDSKYADLIKMYATQNSLPFNLVRAIVKAESDFNPNCTSRVGAMGLMQLMPGTAKLVGVSNAYDPAQNVMGGTKYFRQMLDTFKSIELALAAYNAGPTTVIKAGRRVPNIKETQNYVKKVLFYYNMFGQNAVPFADSEKTNRLAIIYYRRGEIKKAVQEFKKVIKVAPNYAPAYYNLGYIYSQEGEYTRAIDMYKKAIKIDPYLKAAYYNLAITLERRGLLDMAVATWSAYISYETDAEKVRQGLKYIEELRDYMGANAR